MWQELQNMLGNFQTSSEYELNGTHPPQPSKNKNKKSMLQNIEGYTELLYKSEYF
jgi:hypothetical protein